MASSVRPRERIEPIKREHLPIVRRLAVVAIATALLGVASAAHAEPTAQEKETARALMDQGDESFARGDLETARKAYSGAHAIMHVPTTAIEVAKVEEKLGHLARARDALMEAVRYPRSDAEPKVFTAARASAQTRAAALAERIPSVRIAVEGAPATSSSTTPAIPLRILLDGVAIPPDAADLPLKVDPGSHVVDVQGDAIDATRASFVVAERETKRVVVTVHPRTTRATDSAPRARPLRTVGIVTAGVGAAGIVAGAVFGIVAMTKQDDAGCTDNVCRDDAAADTLRAANTWATLSNVAFIAGGVLAASGVTMWLLSGPSSHERSSTTALELVPFGARGTF